jgi:hypothetical protein
MRHAVLIALLLAAVPAGVLWWATSQSVSASAAVAASIPAQEAALAAQGFRDIRCIQTPRTLHDSWPRPIKWTPADAWTFECAALWRGKSGWLVGFRAGHVVQVPKRAQW